ncbi:MAG: amino acid ABC transporter permease [Desulfuromusa sp.]|nr:amino acid ABC transporter permease [Desulfuromusa sp.]
METNKQKHLLLPPKSEVGVFHWVRKNLFNSFFDSIVTICVVAFLLWIIPAIISWMFIDAVGFGGNEALCRSAQGACWPFMREKARLILFGTYPYDQQWRAALASLVVIGLVGTFMLKRLRVVWMILLWVVGGALFIGLMLGSIMGLSTVQTVQWNGLPIFLLLAVFSVAAAFPLGIILALARFQNQHLLIRSLATGYIELIRGIPLLTVLFMGLFILPMIMPQGFYLEPLFAILIALMMFHAAYIAEDIRGGLQILSRGQFEAADSLGFNYRYKVVLVVLPQALKKALPAIFNTLIGAYKDTSLVVIVGIHDMLSTAKMAYSDPGWQKYGLEAYVFVGIWYFTSCWCLSAYGRHLEKKQNY